MSDIRISIVDRNGQKHIVDAPTDMNMNVMELIRSYELVEEGTIGICGGMIMCASCQCYVLNDIEIPAMQAEEEAMLSETYNVKPNSRLSCQIFIEDKMDGLELEIAPEV